MTSKAHKSEVVHLKYATSYASPTTFHRQPKLVLDAVKTGVVAIHSNGDTSCYVVPSQVMDAIANRFGGEEAFCDFISQCRSKLV